MTKGTSYLDALKLCARILQREPSLYGAASELTNSLNTFRTSGARPDSHQDLPLPSFAFVLPEARESIGKSGHAEIVIGGTIRIDDSNIITRQSICATLLFLDQDVQQSNCAKSDNIPYHNGQVLRRFHFDYDALIADDSNKMWPVTHLQYGGKHDERYVPNHWSGASYTLFEKVDCPRIAMAPLDFILVTDFFVRQFKPESGSKIIGDGTWINAALVAQQLFMKPYFERIGQHTPSRNESYYDYACRIKERISFC